MRALPQARFVHADVLHQVFAGISQSAEARRRLADLEDNDEDPAAYMEEFYPHHLTSEAGIAAYGLFIRSILENTQGTALWHCHVGRDRCGMGTMVLEHILGVPGPEMEERLPRDQPLHRRGAEPANEAPTSASSVLPWRGLSASLAASTVTCMTPWASPTPTLLSSAGGIWSRAGGAP